MKSEVMGGYEKAARRTIELIATPAIAGVSQTLSPDAAKALAKTIELLAQEADRISAEREFEAKTRGSVLLGLLVFASLFLLGYLFN